MEWIAEGLTLCFLGVIVAVSVFTFLTDHAATRTGSCACAIMLFIMASVSVFAGDRTAILPINLFHYVKSVVGIMYIAGSYI